MKTKNKKYVEFLENKIIIAEEYGFDVKDTIGRLLPHADPITKWCLKGGRRAIFASFGLMDGTHEEADL